MKNLAQRDLVGNIPAGPARPAKGETKELEQVRKTKPPYRLVSKQREKSKNIFYRVHDSVGYAGIEINPHFFTEDEAYEIVRRLNGD